MPDCLHPSNTNPKFHGFSFSEFSSALSLFSWLVSLSLSLALRFRENSCFGFLNKSSQHSQQMNQGRLAVVSINVIPKKTRMTVYGIFPLMERIEAKSIIPRNAVSASDRLKTTLLKDIMTKNVVTAFPDETLLDALGKLTTAGVGRLPVLDRQTRQLVGILTRTDLFTTYRSNVQS
jgi:CBS-domain-containing membrane protein